MFKNTSGQKIRVLAFNKLTGDTVTGDAANITTKISKDNIIPPVDLIDVNPTEVEDGFYLFDLDQEETNADFIDFYPESSTPNVVVIVPNYDNKTVLSSYSDVDSGLEEIIFMLRILIQDVAGVTYTDSSLSQLSLVAAIIVQQELCFDTKYDINIGSGTINPDPTDNAFKLFVAYKASILLLQSEIKGLSSNSIKIVDGPSSIDLSNRSKDSGVVLKGLYDNYAIMKRDYLLSGNLGQCVITPSTVNQIFGNNFS
jgi:hypothetical protein